MMVTIMIMLASHRKAPDEQRTWNQVSKRGFIHFSKCTVNAAVFRPSRVTSMYFHYESGYDPRDLVAQFRQEKRVAKAIGLTQRRHFLGLMENLVSHFYGISNVDESVTLSRTVMSMNVIKMQMSNEARNILSHWNDHDPPRAPPRTKPPTRKVYKYQCSVSCNQCNVQIMHLLMLRGRGGVGGGGGWGGGGEIFLPKKFRKFPKGGF